MFVTENHSTCMLPCLSDNDCTDTPQPPGSLDITVLSSTDSELSVNLTWSPSRCVMVYYVEVTATNINFTNTTTSQHITLTLQIGVEYSFRVRGADTINRLGQWSDLSRNFWSAEILVRRTKITGKNGPPGLNFPGKIGPTLKYLVRGADQDYR